MMLLRSSILALLVVLPAVLAKKKRRKPKKGSSKLIQEVYHLVDEDSPSLSLDVDFFAIIGFLQMAMMNKDPNITFPYYEMVSTQDSVFHNNPKLLQAFRELFLKPTDQDIVAYLNVDINVDTTMNSTGMKNVTSFQNDTSQYGTGLLLNISQEEPLIYDAENVLSDISLLFNIAGTELISTGLANF